MSLTSMYLGTIQKHHKRWAVYLCTALVQEQQYTWVIASSFVMLLDGPPRYGRRCDTIFLKTLFNIVDAPFNFFFELWCTCMCCMMMFRWAIKQPGIQKFWNLCGLYQDIYDWISPLDKRSGRPFILTQQSMGRNEYGISGHLHIFAFLKHLMALLSCNFFSGLHFYTLSKTLIACRDM